MKAKKEKITTTRARETDTPIAIALSSLLLSMVITSELYGVLKLISCSEADV
jgi:hypothetical protein